MKSILLADDNPQIRHLLRGLLETEGRYQVWEAIDGLDAVEKATDLKPDLIVVDLSMPQLNGLQVARALKPTMSQVPIVLFTSYAEMIRPSDLTAAGVSAVFSKGNALALLTYVKSLSSAALVDSD